MVKNWYLARLGFLYPNLRFMFLKDDLIIFIEKDISEIDIGSVKDEQEH